MKTLGFAMALALTGGAAQAGTVFEIPINGGIARIQLGDNCQWSTCASVSWTENDRRRDRKEQYRKEPAKPRHDWDGHTSDGGRDQPVAWTRGIAARMAAAQPR
jgi:hypothetical protein